MPTTVTFSDHDQPGDDLREILLFCCIGLLLSVLAIKSGLDLNPVPPPMVLASVADNGE